MGRASRRKRERRLAGKPENPGTAEPRSHGPDGIDVDRKGAGTPEGSGWGGRREGTGRPRLYVNDAERQAAYRSRRTAGTSSISGHEEGKPPQGGAAATTRDTSLTAPVGHVRVEEADTSWTVVWYHDAMTKNITVRLPDELAADAEALARVDGTSLNETVKRSLLQEVERRRKSPEFKARLTRIIEEDRELLERLAR